MDTILWPLCGGDGTLDEVVNGMMQCEEKLPIGYIPAGSTNDFANSLKIPKSMIKAADVVVNGMNYACDIGRFNNESFIYVVAFGIFRMYPMRRSRMSRMFWDMPLTC